MKPLTMGRQTFDIMTPYGDVDYIFIIFYILLVATLYCLIKFFWKE